MTLLLENRELRDAFKRGDREALTAVYQEYARPLFGLLARGFTFGSQGQRCWFAGYREPWQLEEAVQEVFTRALAPEARDAYDGLRPYLNYLFAIARNLVIDRHRRGGREEVREVADDFEPPVDPLRIEVSPEEEAASRELQQLVNDFVAALSDRDGGLFEQRFRQGLSIEQVANRLGFTEHAVKKRERAIRKRFFNHMKKHGYFEGYGLGSKGLEPLILLLLISSGPASGLDRWIHPGVGRQGETFFRCESSSENKKDCRQAGAPQRYESSIHVPVVKKVAGTRATCVEDRDRPE